MSHPAELPEALISEAEPPVKPTGFWAGLNETIQRALRLDEARAVQQRGDVKPISECLREVDTPIGRQRLKEVLSRTPFPHYEPASGGPEYFTRIDADGTRAVGRFVGRRYVVET